MKFKLMLEVVKVIGFQFPWNGQSDKTFTCSIVGNICDEEPADKFLKMLM